MQRRGESEQPVKGRRHRATRPKALKSPTAHVSTADLEQQVAVLTGELKEAREQQTATSEVLKVISSSPGELEPVFMAMLENAVRICEAKFGGMFLREGDAFRTVALHNAPPAYAELRRRDPIIHPHPKSGLGRLVATKQVVHIADILEDEGYLAGASISVAIFKTAGARTLLVVPMLKDNEVVGNILIYRQQVRPFTDKQIELVQNFAAQAVIAIENTRLLNELRESLQQQTATADVLKVISTSPGELEPVFNAMLENATRVCDAEFGTLYLRETDSFRAVAVHNAPPAYVQARKGNLVRPPPDSALGQVVATHQVAQVEDAKKIKSYVDGDPYAVSAVELGGYRTIAAVPMLRDDELIGAISIYRQEVRPFTEKQIGLLQNFAAQAVIAIENARLLNELRQRTDDLSEALEQQTATSEVLKVISSSPSDLRPVFQSMLENSVRICEAKFGQLFLCEGDKVRPVAYFNVPAALVRWDEKRGAFQPSAKGGLMRAILSKNVLRIDDFMSEQPSNPVVKLGGARSYIAVPMLKESELVGVIVIYRQEVRPFTEKQIELVKNFATQAVIAIENARLLNELRQRTGDLSEALEQQTATSEVLKVISSSPSELKPVFDAILGHATRICEAKFGTLGLYDGEAFRNKALCNVPPEYAEARQRQPAWRPPPGSASATVVRTKRPVLINDLSTSPGYLEGDSIIRATVDKGDARTMLLVPMLKDDQLVGMIAIYRKEVQPFTDKQIALVQNFAAQAVIAIENARLLNDLNKLNQQLEQRVTDQVSEIERMGRLRRFLPPQVADLIVAAGAEKQLESHRREITALFCDLRGFTGFSESSDPEDVMALLREYHAAIGEIINKYGGTLERYAGDGVMVVFNDPIPVDNPALQAVLMAIDMRAAIGGLIEKWRKLGHDIGFGIGVAHGFATLGTIGFEGRFDYAAIGTVSNVASRLCDEAKPGQILISPRVLMAVESAISVEPVGEFKLKGISRPLATYNVLSAVSAKI